MPSMPDRQIDPSRPPRRAGSSEYGDAVSDILKDQARRKELRKAADVHPTRTRLHPAIPPVLALVSVWLWVFPPTALRPESPSIPPADQEAGLRMEMFITNVKIQRFVTENGRLPNDLADLGDVPDAVQYLPLALNVYRLSGQTGDITVEYTSTEPVEDLLGDAQAIVSGMMPSNLGARSADPSEGPTK